MRLSRMFRDYDAAGAPNSVLAPFAFIDDYTLFTKGGDVARLFRLAAEDYEGTDPDRRATIARRFAESTRLLDDRFRLTQILFKRRVPPFIAPPCAHPVAAAAIQRHYDLLNTRRHELYALDHYAVLLLHGPTPLTSTALRRIWRQPRQAVREWVSGHAVQTVLERDLERACETLHYTAGAWATHLAETIQPALLDKTDAKRVLQRLVNYSPLGLLAPIRSDDYLDTWLAQDAWQFHDDHLLIGGWTTKVLTMAETPSQTFANILEDLHRLSGEFTACLEWHQTPTAPTRRAFWRRKTQYAGQSKQTPVTLGSSDGRTDVLLHDESAAASAAQIGAALTEMEVQEQRFGDCALTLAIADPDPAVVDQAVAEAMKALAHHDGTFRVETYNAGLAWLAMVPGNHAYQRRALPLTNRHLADLSFLFTVDRGQPISPYLQRPALTCFETRSSVPYWWNLHVEDVGHGVMIAPTGAGKTYATNFLITHAQQYDPVTVIIDMGHGYRGLAEALGGGYLDIHLDRPTVHLNPFALPPTPSNLDFQRRFLRVLLEGDGQPPLTDAEDRQLQRAVTHLVAHETEMRRLSTLRWMIPNHLARRLENWFEGGRYGKFFDHPHDDFAIQSLQVLELGALADLPDVLDPVLFYFLHRVRARIRARSSLSLCFLDEVWLSIQHPKVAAYIDEGIRAGRKEGLAMILITQSMQEFGALQRVLIENCPTKLLLANDHLDPAHYRTAFGLTEVEIDLVRSLQPKCEVLIKQPKVSRVCRIRTDPASHAIYAPKPVGVARPVLAEPISA